MMMMSGFQEGNVVRSAPQQAYDLITGTAAAPWTQYNYGPGQGPPTLNSYLDKPGSVSSGFRSTPNIMGPRTDNKSIIGILKDNGLTTSTL